jgi:acetate kinase
MRGCVAVINAGSSSIKFAIYDVEHLQSPMFRGQMEQIGLAPQLHVVNAKKQAVADR